MKKLLFFLFILSCGFNIFYLIELIRSKNHWNKIHDLTIVKNVSYNDGVKDLFCKLRKIRPQILTNDRKFIFIQTWDTITSFDSRQRYLIQLDSIFSGTKFQNMDELLVTEMGDEAVEIYQKNHPFKLSTFIIITEANDFISSVFSLKKSKFKTHPMQMIIDKSGNILYYNALVSGIEEKDSTLYKTMEIIHR